MFKFKRAIHEIEHSRPTLPSNDGQLHLTGAESRFVSSTVRNDHLLLHRLFSGITYANVSMCLSYLRAVASAM